MKKRKKLLFAILAIILTLAIVKIYLEVDVCMTNLESISSPIPTVTIEHKTLVKEGYDIHYFVSGKADGETIILLHPAFSDHRAFDGQIDYLSGHYKVIAIDMIGHGLSQVSKSSDRIDASVEHIQQIMDAEGCAKAHFIGVSMGSLIAQYFGVVNPEKVLSLTALGGYNINKESDEVTKAQNASNMSLMLRALFSMPSFRAKTAELTAYTPQGQAMFFKSASLYRRKSFMSMQGLQNIIKNRDFTPPYPLLILTGEHEIPLAIKMSEDWKKDVPVAEYRMMEGGGHCANMDVPDKFNAVLDEFIQRHSSLVDAP